MSYNITANTAAAQKIDRLNKMILYSLSQNLQLFTPSLFGQANLQKPDYMIPVKDVSEQIPDGVTKGDVIKVRTVGAFTAKDKAPNTPVTGQVPQLGTVDLTLNKHKYVAVLMEDVAKNITSTPELQELASEQAKAIALAMERDVLALASGFSTVVGAGAGSVFGFNTCGEINRRYYQNNIDISYPGNEAHAIIDPTAYEDVLLDRDEYQIAGSPGLDQSNKGRLIEMPHGVRLCRSNHLVKTGGAVKGLAVTKEAIMIGFGIKPRIQKDYILSEIGELQVADVFYGVAELRDIAGQLLDFDEVNGN